MESEPNAGRRYVTAVDVRDAFVVKDLRIELSEDPAVMRHLILTGPNGSGKTTILNALARELGGRNTDRDVVPERSLVLADGPEIYKRATLKRSVDVGGERQMRSVFRATTRGLVSHQTANRSSSFVPIQGPALVDWHSTSRRSDDLGGMLRQFLVNKRTEQAFAREEGRSTDANALHAWFQRIEAELASVLGFEHLTVRIDVRSFEVSLELTPSHSVPLAALPDGFASVLKLWADLAIRFEAWDRDPPPYGFALIDEPELHLHPELEERIMPFLVGFFPNVQFFVATHSPAVISSIDDAVIFDLRNRQPIHSEDVRGVRYGTLMKEHFGIESDFDLDTTRKLKRLQSLRDRSASLSADENEELKRLAVDLSKRSHALALQVVRDLDITDS